MPGGGVVRAPMAWLADYVSLPSGLTATELGDALVRVGLEVERVESGADEMSGPIVVGRVLGFADEPQKNGKTIRWCQVDVGEAEPRGIVCGAANFAAGDLVVVSLPGAALPGPFAISARKTYGHVSDGMICSVSELGIGDEHDGGPATDGGVAGGGGILVLPPDSTEPGTDALDVLGLHDAVLEIAVTPDRGYCLSIRGLAREAGIALKVPYRDVFDTVDVTAPDDAGYPVRVDAPDGAPRFSLRAVCGLDPAAQSPDWMRARLHQAGMRPISLAVDVTNYVMLETGQPLHAYDRAALAGTMLVRRASAGELLVTLDGKRRDLDLDDLVIADESGPIGLAGVMGGAATEIGPHTAEIVLEGACFDPSSVSRSVRRHRLPSEAAKRFERGVDPAIAAVALQRCVDLLVAHGGAQAMDGSTVVGAPPEPAVITFAPDLPSRLVGMPIDAVAVARRLEQVGCTVRPDGNVLQVRPPTWRPDLLMPEDLVEEVARLEGYDRIPSVLPSAPAGGGLTDRQRLLREVSRAVASDGFVEVLSYPFVAAELLDTVGPPVDDPLLFAARLANPLSEAEPLLRTSLLPGLLTTALRNVSRGQRDLALFETGLVFLPRPDAPPAPTPGVDGPPSSAELAAMDAALPAQPRHLAVVLCGAREPAGWWGPARPAGWPDAVQAARAAVAPARVELQVRAAEAVPWHPGRCAALMLDGAVIGHAGELHPRVIAALGLPERTCAMELDLDALPVPAPAPAPVISAYPPVLLDVALVVDSDVPAADLQGALREGAGELLESVRLFDRYTDERLGAGRISLAFALRFRALDRTLTVVEATAARDAAVARATERTGAQLRT